MNDPSIGYNGGEEEAATLVDRSTRTMRPRRLLGRRYGTEMRRFENGWRDWTKRLSLDTEETAKRRGGGERDEIRETRPARGATDGDEQSTIACIPGEMMDCARLQKRSQEKE